MKSFLKIILFTILFILLFYFSLKNAHEATLYFFLGYQKTLPLILWLLFFFCLGALGGMIAFTPTLLRYKRQWIDAHKKLAEQVTPAASSESTPSIQS